MVTQPQRYRISGAEFDRMVEAGVFDPEVHLELIAGEIIRMAPQGPQHSWSIWYIRQTFAVLEIQGQVAVYSQTTIRLPEDYRPEPDLVLLRYRGRDYYRDNLPVAEDVLLVVEVAGSTVDHDRKKSDLYAAAGIPEYWLVNLDASPPRVTVYCEPGPDGYQNLQVVRAGDPLAPLAFPDLAIDTNVLLR